ncbi:MAG: DUF4402 domain-containing protein [Gammaproteobacteria bacterium]|nr:DUF4402 domain-containing protein [Gammaproteobacteria bacterium]
MKIINLILLTVLFIGSTPTKALSINCDKSLRFGTVIAPTNKTIPIYATIQHNSDVLDIHFSNAATRSIKNTASYKPPQRGRCTVTGEAYSKFNITIIPQNTSPDTLTYLHQPNGQLDMSGQQTIYIGGRLNLARLSSKNQNHTMQIEVTCDAKNLTC